ncbi:MAG TPA: glycoside hydrolase family 36 protein [Lachnospiraceae bacterium]|nr:glycoside hydrolase family 36 protein [Lachnospiraceae bacterium]
MRQIDIKENGINIVFQINDSNELKLLHFSSAQFDDSNFTQKQLMGESFQLVQVNFSGYNRPYEKHGNKHIVTAPGYLLKYVDMLDERNEIGRKLTIIQEDTLVTGARVVTHMQFYEGTSIVRCKNVVTNIGTEVQTLEYLSSFCYFGLEKEGALSSDSKMYIRIPHNGWQKEMSWKTYSFPDLGLAQTQPVVYQRTSKTIEVTNTGNWSTKEYLPMGYLENREAGTSLFWQIEHNGSWHYEVGDMHGHFYVCVSGPTEVQSHWFKTLQPGESFESVPVAVGVGANDFSEDMGQLTRYRRMIRRPNKDDENLPVIFNDYMNCLFGDPTTEKEIPLIDAAAKTGCEYFVIDAGWYAPGEWWDSVGEWQESKERFPNGMKEVTDYIRSKGMIPGLWLELEVMGINCDKAKNAPDDWFFVRHGKRVYDRSRYQLDFRNPSVIEHVTEVVDRVVKEYGVGYIKMDYNIEPGIGTELYADSIGQGLLEHEQAYLKWLDTIFTKYPDLVIENCSSGGLRIDYALLSRYSIQSTSDQEDYRNYATIAANAPAGVTPEQAAIWSYPLREGDKEEVIYNMVNALLLRIHQSGHLAELTKERIELVHEAIAYYKTIRADIKDSVPFWPLGLADNLDTWVCLGLKTDKKAYIAVWRRGGETDTMELPIARFFQQYGKQPGDIQVSQSYPQNSPCRYTYCNESGILSVTFDRSTMARIFEVLWS